MIVTEPELVAWGERIGREVRGPLFLALFGPLGAGKSVLARAVLRGAGVGGTIPSPTFNLMFRYEVGEDVYLHLDLYRLEDPDELWELGWEELGAEGEVVLVEWPERAGELIPEDRWEVTLGPPDDDSPELRQVTVRKSGDPAHIPGFPVTLATSPADSGVLSIERDTERRGGGEGKDSGGDHPDPELL